jgi:hypothetical protein
VIGDEGFIDIPSIAIANNNVTLNTLRLEKQTDGKIYILDPPLSPPSPNPDSRS